MLQDIVRLAVAWGGTAALVFFWYWLMSNIGTF